MARKWCTWDDSQPIQKPDGGFVPAHVSVICRLWSDRRHTDITQTRLGKLLALRVYFAALDMGAVGRGAYRPAEICNRIGVKPTGYNQAQVRRAAEALTGLGALKKSGSAIRSADVGTTPMLERIKKGRRRVPLPRRLVRRLARTSHEARMATMLGTFIRCLHSNRDSLDRAGRVQPTWIADVFGVTRSSAHRILNELVQEGVIEQLETATWAKRRWGTKTRVRLNQLKATTVTTAKPPRARADRALDQKKRAPFGRSCLNHHPVSNETEKKYHHPAQSRQRGVSSSGALRQITSEQLGDPHELRRRFDAQGGGSDADWIRWVSCAKRALRLADRNPGGFFRAMITKELHHHIANEDEDRAVNWLKQQQWGVNVKRKPEPLDEHKRFIPAPKTTQPALSADAKLAQAAVALHDSGKTTLHPHTALYASGKRWSSERWNRAVAELGRDELARTSTAPETPSAPPTDTDSQQGPMPSAPVGKSGSCRRQPVGNDRRPGSTAAAPSNPDAKIAAMYAQLHDADRLDRHPFEAWRRSRPALTVGRWNAAAEALGRSDLVVDQVPTGVPNGEDSVIVPNRKPAVGLRRQAAALRRCGQAGRAGPTGL